MAQRPPHFALNPPNFFCFLFLFLLFLGGFKGQVRWPKGPPHLALNPPYFLFVFCFCFFFTFLSLFFNRKNCFPPEKKAFLFILLCFPLFLFSLFGTSSFFTFSFFVSLLFLFSSFLSVSHFCIWFLLFLFVLFVFSFKLFFCFCLSACCLVLFWIIIFVAFIFCFFSFWKPIKNISENMEIPKTAKMKNAEKERTFWQEQLAQVCSQIMSFFLCVSFNFACFAENTIKIGVSTQNN